MRRLAPVVLAVAVTALMGCRTGEPTDAQQQALAKDFSPENVAREYEKQGKMEEAAEVRRSMQQNDQGGQ